MVCRFVCCSTLAGRSRRPCSGKAVPDSWHPANSALNRHHAGHDDYGIPLREHDDELPLKSHSVVFGLGAAFRAAFEDVLYPPIISKIRHYGRRGHLLDPGLWHELGWSSSARRSTPACRSSPYPGAQPQAPARGYQSGLVGPICQTAFFIASGRNSFSSTYLSSGVPAPALSIAAAMIGLMSIYSKTAPGGIRG